MAALLVHSDPDAALDVQNWLAAHTSVPHLHASLFACDPTVFEHALVHSDPDASLAMQYWFAVHTSVPHVH